MEMLQVIKHGQEFPRKFGNNFITEDGSYLHLSYLKVSDIADYNKFFEKLEEEAGAYETVIKLYFETDFINKLPENIKKFTNLTELEVQGQRFWDLNMTQVPKSIQTLILVHHSNLVAECIIGMEKLENLKHLHLDLRPFYEHNVTETFVRLDSLEKIIFYDGEDYYEEGFIDRPIFKDIKEYIKNVENNQMIITINIENREIVITPME